MGNVINAQALDQPVPFVHEADLPTYQKNEVKALEVQVGSDKVSSRYLDLIDFHQVGLHELLGHGTGKLLQETAPGDYNSDIQVPPISPITSKPVSTYYRQHETFHSLFGFLSSSYEECRAECVGMVLSCDFGILKLFGFGD